MVVINSFFFGCSPKVVDSMAVGLSSFKKKYLFGTGNLEKLRGIVLGNERITAVRIESG